MTIAYSCPQCYANCYNTSVDDEDMVEGGAIDFECEECTCAFEVEFHKPTISITRNGFKVEGR